MEEDTIELIDIFMVIWRRKRLIIIGTLVCMITGGAVSFIMPKTYETKTTIKIGKVTGKIIEDPFALSKTITSEPFLAGVVNTLGLDNSNIARLENQINVSIIGEKKLNDSQVLLLTVQADSPQKAVERANIIVNVVIKRHKVLFEEHMKEHYNYEKYLEGQIKWGDEEIKRLGESIRELSINPQVNALAIILLRAQFEEKEVGLVELNRELRDVRIENYSAINSANTTVVDPPILFKKHIKPKKTLNIIVAGVAGLMIFIFIAFFLEYLLKMEKRKQGVLD
jgi:uncharacterized protein involved in exopolysaccharide biosynthesis